MAANPNADTKAPDAQALREALASLDRYRLLSESARDIVLFVRRDGRVADANDAAVSAYGYDRATLLSLTIFDLRDPATAAAIPSQMLEADDPGLTFETSHRRKDGSTFPVEVSSRGADVAGERMLLSIVRDITERKRAEEALREREERFRDLFENANDVIYTLDLDGRITSVNRRAEQVFGYGRGECLGRPAADLVPAEHHGRMREALRRKLELGEAPTTYELEVVRKDGRRVPLEVSSRLILRDGRPVGIQGIARDITERKKAEAALHDADRRKNEFMAMLAHELRNPLAPIRNAAQVLKLLAPPGSGLARARDIIDRQVTHLARLVDDLLDVSRITRGKVQLRIERLDLAALVRAAAEDHRPLFEDAGLRLDAALPDGPVRVCGDPTRLMQMVGNLLQNAAKFTDAGGHVTLRLAADPDAGVATLTVRDTGIGMEAGLLDRLFEPFAQADRSLDRSRGGLGLGLALVKGLAELHDGSVRAFSAGAGRGAEFNVELPLERPDGDAPRPAARPDG